MKNIRIGNDIYIRWSIFTKNGIPYLLNGKNLKLFLSNTLLGEIEIIEFTTEENAVVFAFKGKDQVKTGAYSLTLIENDLQDEMRTIDVCKPFNLVSQCLNNSDDCCDHVEINTLELVSNFDFNTGGSNTDNVVFDSFLSDTSENAVQNKVIAQAIEEAVQRGRLLALRDLYIAAGAMYNDTNEIIKRTTPWEEEVDHLPNHYYLNGLGDIDEDEMFQIYIRKDWISDFFNSSMRARMFQNLNPNVRTVFGAQYGNRWASGVSINTNGIPNPFAGWSKLEVLLWKNNSMIIADGTYCFTSDGGLFFQNNKLKVIGCMKAIRATSFAQCPNLQEIRLYYTAYNIDFSLNPNISKKTLLYLIEKVDPKLKTAITIKLHAAVFAKCSEGGEWYEEVRTALNTVNGYTDENGEEHAGTITGGGSIGLVSA